MRENRTHAAVLAHVIAHEIGHVLLRTNGHNPRGLMSSPWTDFEYGNILRGLMFFTADQSKTMRMALSGAGCANDAVVTRFASISKERLRSAVRAGDPLAVGWQIGRPGRCCTWEVGHPAVDKHFRRRIRAP
jgi:hypothetical protein